MSAPFLLSNSFPFSLIRRRVIVEPRTLGDLLEIMRSRDRPCISAWGHANTAKIASDLLGVDIRPKTERPAIGLGENQLPQLEGFIFTECWILSPEYPSGFRPAIGEEVCVDKIRNWQVLRLVWETSATNS